MFAHWRGHKGSFPERFFLSCGKQDVGPDLLSRFEAGGRVVAPGSHYRHGRGIHCSIERIQWTSKTEAKVWGGYQYGPLGGEWGYFSLKKDHGKWAVISWKPEWFA
jgi:hypothetical protein